MFSVCRERPFFPIADIQNRPLPGPGDTELHAETPPAAQSVPLSGTPDTGLLDSRRHPPRHPRPLYLSLGYGSPKLCNSISRITFSIVYALFAMPYAVNASLANTIEAVSNEQR